MKMVTAGVLTAGLALGAQPAAAQACDPDPVVTVTYDEYDVDPDDPNDGPECDVVSISHDPVTVCADPATITWTFVNHCDKTLKPKIGRRKHLYPKQKKGDPLAVPGDHKPTPEAVAPTKSVSVTVKVDAAARDGRYKYDIAGTIDVDPEIDVRRPTRIIQ